jgi:hypothetical protein
LGGSDVRIVDVVWSFGAALNSATNVRDGTKVGAFGAR